MAAGGTRRDAATRKDELRIGTPVWMKSPRISAAAAAELPAGPWDAVVVGAGISGALTAEALTAAGLQVLILDRRAPVRGSTPASTAMIQHEIDLPLIRLIRQSGRERAERAWRRSARAVDDLVALTARLGIDCGMERKQALYLAGDAMGGRGLKAEAAARRRAGLEAEFLNARDLAARFGIDRTGAIVSQPSASANPAQLTAGLLAVARGRGAAIAAPVEVSDMAELPGGVALATRDGRVLTAGHAVFCTGYEFLPQMRSASHRVTSTWALASRPRIARPDWLDGFLVWEASEPYLYFRSTPDGRIIAGGEDEDSPERNSDPRLLARKAAAIAAKLEAVAGIRIGRPAYAWAAPFSATSDGLPIIDRVPGCERVFAVMGFGGNGITFSMVAAQIVAAAIAGRPDPDAGLFAFR